MLNDATCFKTVYIVCGYTDLRSGMDRLAALIEAQTGNKPYVPDTLYLFCGRRSDRIKGLVWEGDGWLLLYKRLSGSQLFFVKYFSLKKASEFPFFSKGFSLPSAGIMHPCA